MKLSTRLKSFIACLGEPQEAKVRYRKFWQDYETYCSLLVSKSTPGLLRYEFYRIASFGDTDAFTKEYVKLFNTTLSPYYGVATSYDIDKSFIPPYPHPFLTLTVHGDSTLMGRAGLTQDNQWIIPRLNSNAICAFDIKDIVEGKEPLGLFGDGVKTYLSQVPEQCLNSLYNFWKL